MQQRGQTAELSGDVVWHGRTADAARLIRSIEDHCSCQRGAPPGRAMTVCEAHQILADQHLLDHLAFARSVLDRIVAEEWHPSAASAGGLNMNEVEWSALTAERVPAQMPGPEFASSRRRRAESPRSAFVSSLLALLFVLCLGAPAYPVDAPIGQPIASWFTR